LIEYITLVSKLCKWIFHSIFRNGCIEWNHNHRFMQTANSSVRASIAYCKIMETQYICIL